MPLFLNSELVVGAVTELWAAEQVAAGDESATVVDTKGKVVGCDCCLLQGRGSWVLDTWWGRHTVIQVVWVD